MMGILCFWQSNIFFTLCLPFSIAETHLKWWWQLWWWWCSCCGEERQSVTLLLSPACRCATAGGPRLPTLSAQEYLFICLPFRRENNSFFIFGHGESKQVVPSALRHTLSAQSTALRSVFYTDGCRPSDLFVSDIFPWQTGRIQRLRGGLGKPQGRRTWASILTLFWKWNLWHLIKTLFTLLSTKYKLV